ncbi:MAG: aminopeptidase P family protein [Caldilineaceae bacterium]|nr:aminopeptidase P family protein [Caldilineaceae bacterium]
MNELERKLARIRTFMAQKEVDALLLESAGSFAWATCGASSYINTAATNGLGSVLITQDHHYILTTNIEAPRIGDEEGTRAQGWEVVGEPWHVAGTKLADLTAGLRVGADSARPDAVNLAADVARLRVNLSPEEVSRFQELGQICAAAMDEAIRSIKPGMSEYEIAGTLAQSTEKRGAQPIVNLIATDERIFRFRHPLPTAKTMDAYAMLVLCGRRQGLVASITRLVHFGALSDELQRKMDATATVDAAFLSATRPGATLGQVVQAAQEAYAATGFADEWMLHHQGGPAAFEPREYLGVPGSTDTVQANQVYAWNPSITGTKSEDTILIGETENSVLTTIAGWPMIDSSVNGQTLARPAILVVD